MSVLKTLFWLIVLTTNQLIAIENSERKLSPVEEMLISAAIGASVTTIVMISAPYVVPVGAVLSVKAIVGTVAAKASLATSAKSVFASAVSIIKVATPIASQVNSSITGIYLIKRCLFPSIEQKVEQLLLEKSTIPFEQELKKVFDKKKMQ